VGRDYLLVLLLTGMFRFAGRMAGGAVRIGVVGCVTVVVDATLWLCLAVALLPHPLSQSALSLEKANCFSPHWRTSLF